MPVACSNSGIVFLSMYSAQFEIVRSPVGLPCALAVGWPFEPPPDPSMPPLLPQAASAIDAAQTPSAAARPELRLAGRFLQERVLRDRPPGGLAQLWHQQIGELVDEPLAGEAPAEHGAETLPERLDLQPGKVLERLAQHVLARGEPVG